MDNLIVKFLLFFMLGSIQACSSDDTPSPPIKEKTFTIKVVYTKPNDNIQYPDSDSRIFIYYNFPATVLFGCKYISDGKFVNRDSTFVPAEQESTNDKGIALLNPVYPDKAITIVVESHYYNRLAYIEYENYQKSISAEFIFGP